MEENIPIPEQSKNLKENLPEPIKGDTDLIFYDHVDRMMDEKFKGNEVEEKKEEFEFGISLNNYFSFILK